MTTSTTAMEAGRAFWRARLSSSSTHDGMVATTTTTTTRGLDEALTAGECVAFGLPRGKAASQTSKATVVGMYAAVLDGRGYGFGGGARDVYRRACDAPLTTSVKDVCRFEAVKSDDATRARGAERGKSFDPKPTDGATQLVVMRVGKYYGFRSHAAGGSCCRRVDTSETGMSCVFSTLTLASTNSGSSSGWIRAAPLRRVTLDSEASCVLETGG